MKELSYHCSPTGNIQIFEPSVSRGFPVVFSTPYKTLAYVFGIKDHNDYKISLQTEPLRIIEMCPNALERFYKEQSAYLYTFNASDFNGRTQWSGEITSEKPVKPLSIEFVPDLQTAILDEEKSGNLEILRFDERNKYINKDEQLALHNLSRNRYYTDSDYASRDISYISSLGNKNIVNLMRHHLTNAYQCICTKNTVSSISSQIIPDEYKEKYSKNCSDDIALEIISSIFTLNDEDKRLKCIDEVKSLNNKELTAKITFKLKGLNELLQSKIITIQNRQSDYSL